MFSLVLKSIFEEQCVYDSNMSQNSNFINGQGIMNEYNEKNYDNILNNEIMKTLLVFLGKSEVMNERFEAMSDRLKTIEENQLKIIRKIEEGEVKVKLEKNLDFENDFRDVTSTEDMSIRQEDKKDFIENLGKKEIKRLGEPNKEKTAADDRHGSQVFEFGKIDNFKFGFKKEEKEDFDKKVEKNVEDSWAKRLFKNENRFKKVKIEVQGSVDTSKYHLSSEDKWSCAPVELFICNTDVETSEEDVKEAAKEIIKLDLQQLNS